ncbi:MULTISPECIES: NADH-quinone oxidoreductase subunit J [Chromobacterium]|uniref:NADH-quinone oxidoreductase subunit J n=2 Tax=Chromobacterium TaxID=535 RepID=A0A1W0CY34_9NEIS|nr:MULTISPECIES: NADH-quinone oxidoreductase subunit J [Chromobacterium]AXT47934.1 NADH-quinone oxidoreductase subunit J [Chromobacterium rhizoryzae]KMN82577.1 NADH:ubiquinone oxidoreductase subunit J [Chromobacterium sp. LK11]MBK0416400.1 NADH-quinone oxidoreductase subunit J [Chromobacterium haemolyticum]MBN3005930.1 NADH-quinone oxidoreductase subunit J [Chromobacterium alkanivorans]MBO0417646.1 NADH-quinone oxidoreductase subunit J [Chromobacterium haemolyticum]
MNFTMFVFYVLSAILVFAGIRVVTAKNPIHAALFLVLAFFNSAGLWLLMEAEFLAITLVVVYVGAVMVLFLFVVMMLDINIEKLREGFWKNLPVAAAVGIIMVFEMAMILASPSARLDAYQAAAPLAADFSNVKVLGRQLYTTYLLPFEVAAVVLLLAMVAAIGLTMRSRKDTKAIDPALQVKVKRNDRVRLVKMQAEQPAEESTVEEASEAESGKQQA